MSIARSVFTILGSPSLYIVKFLFLAILGAFMGSIISHSVVFIISLVFVGFVLHLVFAGIHEALFGFRYGSWNDNASTERYVSGYEGRGGRGFSDQSLRWIA